MAEVDKTIAALKNEAKDPGLAIARRSSELQALCVDQVPAFKVVENPGAEKLKIRITQVPPS
jgi:hypothetical protein